jgi:hypothetical protein
MGMMPAPPPLVPFAQLDPSSCYLGFVDLLGFSSLVLEDFDRARTVYDAILKGTSLLPEPGPVQTRPSGVDITAGSDSFVVVGQRLQHVANWSSGIQVAAMRVGMLVRGSIAFGRHVQQNVHRDGTSRHHTLLVSEALTRAVADESHRKDPPCGITLDPSVPPEAIAELDAPLQRARQRSIVFKGGRWMTNPFGAFEIQWARPKLDAMLEEHRDSCHRAKYEWMLELYRDVSEDRPLKPELHA